MLEQHTWQLALPVSPVSHRVRRDGAALAASEVAKVGPASLGTLGGQEQSFQNGPGGLCDSARGGRAAVRSERHERHDKWRTWRTKEDTSLDKSKEP